MSGITFMSAPSDSREISGRAAKNVTPWKMYVYQDLTQCRYSLGVVLPLSHADKKRGIHENQYCLFMPVKSWGCYSEERQPGEVLLLYKSIMWEFTPEVESQLRNAEVIE